MAYKIYTVLVASEDEIKDTQSFVRVSLKNSEIIAPVLVFDSEKDGIVNVKNQIVETLDSLLMKVQCIK